MTDDVPSESAPARRALEAFLDRLAKAVADRLTRPEDGRDLQQEGPRKRRGDRPNRAG